MLTCLIICRHVHGNQPQWVLTSNLLAYKSLRLLFMIKFAAVFGQVVSVEFQISWISVMNLPLHLFSASIFQQNRGNGVETIILRRLLCCLLVQRGKTNTSKTGKSMQVNVLQSPYAMLLLTLLNASCVVPCIFSISCRQSVKGLSRWASAPSIQSISR